MKRLSWTILVALALVLASCQTSKPGGPTPPGQPGAGAPAAPNPNPAPPGPAVTPVSTPSANQA